MQSITFLLLCWPITITLIFADNDASDCPFICKCLGQFIDCRDKMLLDIPHNIPPWVTSLDLSKNMLNAVNVSQQLNFLTDIVELKLSQNALSVIPINHTLYNLTTLKVSHNKLSESSFGVLRHLPNLRELDMNTNFISVLSNGLIPPLSTLRSLNLNSNKITNIEKGSLDLPKLTNLMLAKNLLRNLSKEVLQNLTSLKTLDLSRNRFSKLEGLSFKGLKALVTLKLRSSYIQKLEDGAFFGLDSLVSLHLDLNSISDVTDGWLFGLSSLQQLYLSHNKIQNLNTIWEFCQQLRELDLSHNLLRGIERDALQHLSKLTYLKLDYNQITYIAEGAFNHTPSLTHLELNGNKISWTIEDMQGPFLGLKQLTRLGLADNLITSVSEKALVGLENLMYLDLSANKIKTIHSAAMSHVPLLRELGLNSTSLVCDCGLAWLPEYLSRTAVNTTDMYCAYPTDLNGQLITHVPQQRFTCSPDDFPKPRIVEEPATQVALAGSNVTLSCAAVSSSDVPLSFVWRRNNQDLTEPAFHSLTDTHTHVSRLLLSNVTLDASALYQCIVSNDFGTDYSRKANLSVYMFPQLVKTPSNVTTKTGSMARLECAASGHPPPQIGWQKDGGTDFPAAQERRVHVMPTDDVFFIVNVKPVDSGVYSCTAKNIAGLVVANATLTVTEAPSFVKKMEDKEVKVGEAVVLECMAAGWPKPTLSWTKNGGPLALTERHFFTAEDQLLIIMDAEPADSGLYTCQMTNSLGSNKGVAHLTVLPVYDSGNEEDMTGVIIITVVCCAVATSIVWVIIIYQTRKRLSPATTAASTGPTKAFHLDNKSEHSSSSKDSGTGDSTKRSHEDLLLETVSCVHQEGEAAGTPEVTLPLLTSFHQYPDPATAVYKVTPRSCCCDSVDSTAPVRTDHDRPAGHSRGRSYLCVPVYLPHSTPPTPPPPPPPPPHSV